MPISGRYRSRFCIGESFSSLPQSDSSGLGYYHSFALRNLSATVPVSLVRSTGKELKPGVSNARIHADEEHMTTIRTSFYLPLGLAIGGMLFYHLAQKSIPKEINPFYAMIIAYAAGIVVLTICALTLSGNRSFISSIRESNWAVIVVGVAAACIELGFLLAYRSGWRISVAAVATNVAVTLMLVPIGLVVFKDHLSLRNVLGLMFCVLGLILVVRE